MSSLRVLCGIFVVVFLMSESWAKREHFVDPLDTPAAQTSLGQQSNLVGIARAGQRLVAVGELGLILLSDDAGKHWEQAAAPVSTDLVAVYFVDDLQGWAVGHDGVILHTRDAGSSWTQQLSGREIVALAKKHYASRAVSGEEEAAQQQQNIEQLETTAPAFSFLDVWFRDANEGYAVGAFNLIFKTSDGGQNWEPWFDRTDNPRSYHLYSIRGDAHGVYASGELGLLMRLDEQAQRFVALESPYQGSFFGTLVRGDRVIAFGLRGTAFASNDKGLTWQKLENPSDDGLASGMWLSNGDALLLSQGGELLRSSVDTLRLTKLKTERGYPSNSAALVEGESTLAVVGPVGVIQLQFN